MQELQKNFEHEIHMNIPVIQHWYKSCLQDKYIPCALCDKGRKAVYYIEFYNDLEYAMSRLLAGEDEDELVEKLWVRAIAEQSRGIYRRYATIFGCSECIIDQFNNDMGNASTSELHKISSHLAHGTASVVLLRYSSEPFRPIAVYNNQHTIEDFVRVLKQPRNQMKLLAQLQAVRSNHLF